MLLIGKLRFPGCLLFDPQETRGLPVLLLARIHVPTAASCRPAVTRLNGNHFEPAIIQRITAVFEN
jgi:hypothetical protein